MFKSFLKHFKAYRGIKLVIFSTLFLILLLLGFLVVSYISEKSVTVTNLLITNITDSSATVTFQTSELSNPNVVVSEDNNFNLLNQLSKPTFSDDRDTTNRYTHHITLTNLKSNSKYYYRITTGFKNIDINYPTLETGPVLDTLVVPNPSYAKIEDNNFRDSIVYLSLGSSDSQIVSTYLNDNNAFSLDKSNIRTKDLTKIATINNGDSLNFKLVNSYGTYTFTSSVGDDQPVSVVLTKDEITPLGSGLNKDLVNPVLACSSRSYNECCGSGLSRSVTVTCPNGANGGESFSSGSCNQSDSACGQKNPDTTTCPAGQYYTNGHCVVIQPAITSSSSSRSSSSTTSTATTGQYASCGRVGDSCGRSGTCRVTGCEDSSTTSTPTVTNTSSCTESIYQCSGKNVQKCIGGNWNTVDICDGTTQKCSNGSCVAVNANTGQQTETNVNSNTEAKATATQPQSTESTTDCEKILDTTLKLTCLGSRSSSSNTVTTNNGTSNTVASTPNYSDCTEIHDAYQKWKCLSTTVNITTATTIPDKSVCDGGGNYCNGTTLVNCTSKAVVGSTKSCAEQGLKCCVNSAGVADTCNRTCPTDKSTTATKTTVSTIVDVCSKYVSPFNENSYRDCCAGNPNSPTCKPKITTAIGVYNQYDPKIVNQYGLGLYSCGLTAFSSSLAELGVADFYKTMEQFGKEKAQINYDPNAGIDYQSLLKASKDFCKELGCSVGTNDYRNPDDFLANIKVELDKGRQLTTLIAFRDDGTGTIPVDPTEATDSRNHFLRITGYDPKTKIVTLAETQLPGVNGRQTQVVVSADQFLKSVHKMGGTNYWTEVVAKDKSIDTELAAKAKDYEVGVAKKDITTVTSLKLDKGLVSPVKAATNTTGNDNTYQLDTTGVYNINSITGYTVYTKELKILDQNDLKLKFFDDLNGNGVREDNEPYINEPLDVSLEKVSEVVKLDLKEGWNLINMNMVTDNVKTANDLLIEIARQGGYATHIATYRNGKWIMFSQRAGNTFGENFNLVPTEGYFVRVHKAVSLTLEGKYIVKNTPIYLSTGWNLLGIRTDADKKASTLIDEFNKTDGIAVDTITKYEDGRYGNLVKESSTIYGQDFVINGNLGYFVRATKGGKVVSSY